MLNPYQQPEGESKVLVSRIADAASKCCDWEDGEITGFDMEKFEQKVAGILHSPPQSQEEQEKLWREVFEITKVAGWNKGNVLEELKGYTIIRKQAKI